MRFSCVNVFASARPSPSRPSMEVTGTRTSLSVTSAWSVGMLNVHHMKSTENPSVFTGTTKQLMPSARPSSPDVRAKIISCVAVCMPLLKRFLPLITNSSPSRTAFVSNHDASDPWFGSVSPKATRVLPVNMPSRNCFFCSSVP